VASPGRRILGRRFTAAREYAGAAGSNHGFTSWDELWAYTSEASTRSTHRRVCRLCLDWTERRPHIAGAVGPVDASISAEVFIGVSDRFRM